VGEVSIGGRPDFRKFPTVGNFHGRGSLNFEQLAQTFTAGEGR
jgi:hypothetical protein